MSLCDFGLVRQTRDHTPQVEGDVVRAAATGAEILTAARRKVLEEGTGLAQEQVLDVLRLIPGAAPQLIESSCCGMAGSFGYEASHYDVSMKMAEASLLPAIRNAPDAIVVADGTSCRQQIAHGAARESVHVARLLARLLPEPAPAGAPAAPS